MLKRNKKAVCKTCPYWDGENKKPDPEYQGIFWGKCKRDIISVKSTKELDWFGCHPDFLEVKYQPIEAKKDHV